MSMDLFAPTGPTIERFAFKDRTYRIFLGTSVSVKASTTQSYVAGYGPDVQVQVIEFDNNLIITDQWYVIAENLTTPRHATDIQVRNVISLWLENNLSMSLIDYLEAALLNGD